MQCLSEPGRWTEDVFPWSTFFEGLISLSKEGLVWFHEESQTPCRAERNRPAGSEEGLWWVVQMLYYMGKVTALK